jgi:hypothetical protein
MAMRFAALSALALIGTACGGAGNPSTVRTTSVPDVELVRLAPKWVRLLCREESSVVRGRILCPGRLPDGIWPGPNERTFKPWRLGYVVEGYTASHWVFGAFPARTGLAGYGRLRTIGIARVAGRPARYLFASPAEAGIFAGHEILSWREGGFVYAVSVHTGVPKRPPPPELLQIALAMRRY